MREDEEDVLQDVVDSSDFLKRMESQTAALGFIFNRSVNRFKI